MQIDATRQRIPSGESQAWRAAWRLATSEVLFGLAVACTGVGVVAMMGLLQMPTLGTDDPVAFSRWATAARQQQGELFDLLTTLGLNNVMHAVWWQVAALLSLLIATLRFADVLAWARYAQHNAAILDEERASVIHTTPSLQRLAAWLQDQALRTREVGENTLAALSGWRSHVAAGLLYGGVMLTSAALLVDARLGWLAGEQLLVAEVPISLPDQRTLMLSQAGDDAYQFRIEPSGSTVALREGQSGALDGVSLHTKRVVEGYRASAERAGQALRLRASNLALPTTELRFVLDEDEPEQFLALPEAQLALALRYKASEAPMLQVFALPSGSVITTAALTPSLIVGDVRLVFRPAPAVSVEAAFLPGRPFALVGAALATLGAVGTFLWPRRRVLLLQRGEWLEIYAAGRGALPLARRLVQQLTALAASSDSPTQGA